jgi:hypothetical protein
VRGEDAIEKARSTRAPPPAGVSPTYANWPGSKAGTGDERGVTRKIASDSVTSRRAERTALSGSGNTLRQ